MKLSIHEFKNSFESRRCMSTDLQGAQLWFAISIAVLGAKAVPIWPIIALACHDVMYFISCFEAQLVPLLASTATHALNAAGFVCLPQTATQRC